MEKIIDKNGYIRIYSPEHNYSKPNRHGYILEHRAVVENFLGRRLLQGETIHHINFDKKNNSIDNLMLFKSPKEHSKFHQQIKQFGFTTFTLKKINERWDNESIKVITN